ncbi:hypothetical protein NBRC116601_20590 [Cognatishimia sp. WU-CL00825]
MAALSAKLMLALVAANDRFPPCVPQSHVRPGPPSAAHPHSPPKASNSPCESYVSGAETYKLYK